MTRQQRPSAPFWQPTRRSFAALTAFLFMTLAQSAVEADDWYRWRGPSLDGKSVESDWNWQWDNRRPPVAWRQNVGTGFSSVTVSRGRVFTMGNSENTDTVYCLDAETGKIRWSHAYPCALEDKFFEGGPTSTPTVDGSRVFSLSREGHLFCLEVETGKVVWSANMFEDAKVRIPGWGFSCSPLVRGELLLLNVGEAGTAVNKKTGKVVWTSADKDAGYATPVPYVRAGKEAILIGSGRFYIAVDAASGKELWRHRWLTRFGANAADPIISGPFAFLSSGYNRGSALLRIDGNEPVVVWTTKEMQNQMNSSVLVGRHLYGVDGGTKTESSLKCLEFKSGKVLWSQPGFGVGSLTVAEEKLIILGEDGKLVIANASPAKFSQVSKLQVLSGKCWTVPVLSNGKIYCRNADGDVACVDVSAPKK